MSILFAKAGRKVIAVEPEPSNSRVLRANLASNCVTIELIERYVGVSYGGFRLDDLPVDRCVPGFLKIDIEGYELEALETAPALLAGQVMLLVETHSRRLEAECAAFLCGLGYRTTIIDRASWRWVIPELRGPENR